MEVDKVADKVANMVANMAADMAADKKNADMLLHMVADMLLHMATIWWPTRWPPWCKS